MLRKACFSFSMVAIFSSLALADVGAIRFKNGPLEIQRKSPQQVAEDLGAFAAQRTGAAAHAIVQFDQPVSDADKVKLRAAGVSLLDYLGANGFFAAVDAASFDAGRIAEVASLTRSAAIEREHKLHAELLSNRVYNWMIVESKKGAKEVDGTPDPVVGVYVKFHSDVTMEPDAVATALQHGAFVRSVLAPVNSLVIELPYSQIQHLVSEDGVSWIEPPLPLLTEVNLEAQTRTGANIVQAAPYGLNGTGITALVFDGGRVRATHQQLTPRAQVGVGEAAGISDHSTHVAGTVGGNGTGNAAAEGMAPNVGIVSYALSASGAFLYTNPGDLQADYTSAINTYGADIANNSIGTNTATNGFPCSWEGDYGVTDTVIDAIVRGSISPGGAPFRIVWANGNERQTTTCNDPNVTAGYHKTAPPACAKNHITVGALNSNTDGMTTFSSWGPADDDRLKPDVAAPGCQTGGDGGLTSAAGSTDTAYASMCGTSMSAPVVTGLSSLLLQDYCAQFPARCPGGNNPDMRNSTLKILLAHTAVDLGNVGPDYQYGYGSVRIQSAIDFMRTGNFLENSVSQDGVFSIFVVVAPGAPSMKVTLAWDDPPGTPNVNPALVNDLDLVVFDTSNNQRYPWTLGGLHNPAGPAIQTQKNSIDNIEQISINSPPAGLYRVEVRGYSVPQGPQAFSLCATPTLVSCADFGYAAMDKSQYSCTSTAALTVVDCDLNTNNLVAETVNVTVTSTSEPGGEIVTLTETGLTTAKFTGSLPFSTTNSPGVLQVANGNAVTLTYVDADDGQGGLNVPRTFNASVDCVQSTISDVRISNVGARTATVTFVTNENTKGTARYGASCGSLTGSASEIPFRTSHTVVMTSLSPLTTYFMAVDAADPGGNITTADNGGACYTFTTLAIPSSLTENFIEGGGVPEQIDLDNKSILFTPQQGSSGYAMCTTSILSLPTDPTGGTAVTGWAVFPGSTGPLDDGTAYLTVAGGNTVKLHGRSYDYMHVSTNGNIHFATPDGDYDKTLPKHYAQPRISALFDDLNLTSQGTCTWKQLADRFAVTWDNVPEYTTTGTGPGNTFQIEMFFDGRIRISYLSIPNLDGIVGLSGGGGLSPDYTDTDLSGQSACGPEFPPYAFSESTSTSVNTFKNVSLTAFDYDGDAITYVITSLPFHGTLRDPVAGGTIVSTPYTLAGGGSTVRYTPVAGYLGADYFDFKSNDGGVPTTGGDSNVASITMAVTLPTGTVLNFPVDTNQGWTLGVLWSFGTPLGGCGDPTSGFTGANVFGNVITAAGCYTGNSTPIRYLTTTAINCSGLSGVKLRFKRWLNIEPNDRANIQVSRNGTTWTEVWSYISATLVETSWSTQTYDISAIADGQSTVFIRWGMGPTNATTNMGGWNLDDIEILASVAAPCGSILRGDVNLNSAVTGTDIQKFVTVLLNPGSATQQEICAADCFTDGAINMQDLDEMVNLLLNITVP